MRLSYFWQGRLFSWYDYDGIGAFDDPHAFKPKGEIYTNYKLNWLKDDGCIQESFEEAAVEERLMALLTGLEDR